MFVEHRCVTNRSRSSRLCSCQRPTVCPISWMVLPVVQFEPRMTNCSPPRMPTFGAATAPGTEGDKVLLAPSARGTGCWCRASQWRERLLDPLRVGQARVDPEERRSRRASGTGRPRSRPPRGQLSADLRLGPEDISLEDRHPPKGENRTFRTRGPVLVKMSPDETEPSGLATAVACFIGHGSSPGGLAGTFDDRRGFIG